MDVVQSQWRISSGLKRIKTRGETYYKGLGRYGEELLVRGRAVTNIRYARKAIKG